MGQRYCRHEEEDVCLQAMAAWKLLGEYTGVWDNHETVSQRINDDPIGLGTMRRDKVTEFACTSRDAPQEAQEGMFQQTSQAPLPASLCLLCCFLWLCRSHQPGNHEM